jgi:hypothetical protein
MNNYTIAITTFSLRLNMIESLVGQIRNQTDRRILICVNGEKDGNFTDVYRKKILELCMSYTEVYPIFFIEIRGLAKMWNTLLSHSNEHHVMLLNDDVSILNNDIFDKTQYHINSADFSGLTLINSSFSHYIVDRRFIDKLGYFDERLLGFGEEDGDIIFRMSKYGYKHSLLWVSGLVNMISQIRHEHVKKGSINNVEHKYSHFNRDFIYGKKYKTDFNSPNKGMFDTPMEQVIEDIKVYPYESFFWDNKNNL